MSTSAHSCTPRSPLSAERSRSIKAQALALGFHRAGVAELAPAEHGAALLRWLARGDQAGMAWMERRTEERLDPRKLVPWARSVVCVALHYHPAEHATGSPQASAGNARVPAPAREGSSTHEDDFWPRVARYARGTDYHELMWGMLDRLAEAIVEAYPGTQTRRYVDTGPVLERELAARAGLGRIGKNTNLLHRSGSWFFLGELFLDLELEPDAPLADMCGSCTRCLEACPTGAFSAPYQLDSRRCISYWTIEHRGALPQEVRDWLGDWVFGCDVCQEVCPWNLKPERDGVAPEIPRQLELGHDEWGLQLTDLPALSKRDFAERFAESPLRRARWQGLLRNVVVTLGNLAREDTLSALADILGVGTGGAAHPTLSRSSMLRRHAAWALGAIGTADARETLRLALVSELDPVVRSELVAALSRFR